ncbi:hypothetical protein ACFX11_025794 [Malus domestica]
MRCSCFGASVAERKRKSGSGQFGHDPDENVLENIKVFSYNELRSATDNFHPSNKIGRGGFGTVYKVLRLCICLVIVIIGKFAPIIENS